MVKVPFVSVVKSQLVALSPVALATIVAEPTPVAVVAVLVPVAVPLTPEVDKSSPLTQPLIVSLNVGLAAPYKRLWLSAVTVRWALPIVKVPFVSVVKSQLVALSPVALATIVAAPTPVAVVAVLLPVAVPVTPEVDRFSLFTKPVMV